MEEKLTRGKRQRNNNNKNEINKKNEPGTERQSKQLSPLFQNLPNLLNFLIFMFQKINLMSEKTAGKNMNRDSIIMLNIPISVEFCIPSLDNIWLVNLFLGQPLIALSKQPFSLYSFIYLQQYNYVTVYCLGYCSFRLTSFFII